MVKIVAILPSGEVVDSEVLNHRLLLFLISDSRFMLLDEYDLEIRFGTQVKRQRLIWTPNIMAAQVCVKILTDGEDLWNAVAYSRKPKCSTLMLTIDGQITATKQARNATLQIIKEFTAAL